MITHLQRRHPGNFDPLSLMKEANCNFSTPKNHKFSSFRSPQNNLPDPMQSFGNAKTFQDILRDIKDWNNIELTLLIIAITRLPNFTRHSNVF